MSDTNEYLNYFYSRGLNNSTIEAFKLGWCTPAGRCFPSEYSVFIDGRFNNSVLFPIFDLYDRLIAVGTRNIDHKDYIHSKYTKSKHLFGLNVTHKHILPEKEVYIVEGNFDLLTLYQHGITNVVAMLGTKLSLDQISLLSRFADKFILAMDGDDAGRESARKTSGILKQHDIDFEVLRLPQGSDPDSFMKSNGANAFKKLRVRGLLERVQELI